MSIMDLNTLDPVQTPTMDVVVPLEEGSNPLNENMDLSPLVAWVRERFTRSRDRRYADETRWLEAYRNFRGVYGNDVAFTDNEQSQIFVKVTKQKVLAAVAQIGDVLFAGNKFPIGIEPTPVPLGVPEKVHVNLEQQAPGAKPVGPVNLVRPELLMMMKSAGLDRVPDKIEEGAGLTPNAPTWEPAAIAAKKMEKKIHDQLEESDASKHLRHMAFEMSLFGTGIIKGPFAIDKEYPKWDAPEASDDPDKPNKKLGTYNPVIKTIPRVSSVSIWNFYPDADAYNMDECEGVVERHKLSAHQMRELKKRPMFRPLSIDEALKRSYNYTPEHWESILEDGASTASPIERYEVLEYWGMISRDVAIESGLEIPTELEDMQEFQINAWTCNDQILRLVINPYTPTHIPYYATPYELNPYSFFGIGVAENMADTQMLMNGVMRMAVDNLALSGNLLIEVDEQNLTVGQDFKLTPGKIFRRSGGAPGQAIFGTKFPNVTNELLQVYDKARQLTDESTNMPSYAHGGTGVPGMGRTASGMSMLMGAAAQSTKAIVRNIDDYFLSPLGKNLFAFNMQFDYDPEIQGDLAIVARGTESLMRNEIRSQRLLEFLQTGTANPATAPLVKVDYILRELATSLDLDADLIVNDQREMMIQADIIKKMSAAMGTPTAQEAPAGQDPTGTGGGTIAPGNAPTPGANGFTGAGGGDNGGNTTPPAQPQQG